MRDNHNNTPTINVTNIGTHQYDTNNNAIISNNTNNNKSYKATLTGKKTSSVKTSTTTTMRKELMTPVRIQNIRGFDATLAERRKNEEEKAEKKERDSVSAANSSGGVEGKTGVRMINMEPSVDERVDRKQVRENAVDAYYRRLAAADVEDVWKQKRPVGGENTLIRPRQKVAREKISAGS